MMPTPVPTATEIIRFCTGKARETAFRASSLSLATKTLSTTLYSAWTSMEMTMGIDMVKSSLGTGMVPILFSAAGRGSFIGSLHFKYFPNKLTQKRIPPKGGILKPNKRKADAGHRQKKKKDTA